MLSKHSHANEYPASFEEVYTFRHNDGVRNKSY